ncbi:hypothetical protein C8F01DRAFT_1146871 [Mycena amicta]|nr:hypothetical protein C8F01DRAFT_1146871 [Mycena amicta]
MSVQKAADDVWSPLGITSQLKLHLQPAPAPAKAPTWGLGWLFSCSVEPSSRQFLSDDGTPLSASSLSLFFDPHRVRSADYGRLSITVDDPIGAIVDNAASCTVEITLPYPAAQASARGHTSNRELIAKYICNQRTPLRVSVTIGFPDASIALPRSIGPKLERLLADTMEGKDTVDLKFYVFSRRSGPGRVTSPQAVYAKASLLEGYSDSLNDLISGGGFTESSLVEIGKHTFSADTIEEYDYMSDSDLDDEEEDTDSTGSRISFGMIETDDDTPGPLAPRDQPATPPPPTPPSSLQEIPSTHRLGMGRAVVIRGTAFRTWKALIYYIYTSKLSFSPNPTTSGVPTCSAKSMYRLADKLNLDTLKSTCFASIKTHLTTANVVDETFSRFTSYYPEVQDAGVAFILKNFTAVKPKLDAILGKVTQGEMRHCTDVLCKIVAGRQEPESLFGPRTPELSPGLLVPPTPPARRATLIEGDGLDWAVPARESQMDWARDDAAPEAKGPEPAPADDFMFAAPTVSQRRVAGRRR